ncbi:MFS transporter [Pseudohoeflea suaedae]|uniref:MFS transporter n=1 Tax=Pseudohoeflea suaedae TaxID=877384 RepID=A0A4R5PM54_9HYPH|nr:MFS transporter [Pseudohoeflea suaedae]TDH37611.1 MFS transporter [Pseudohoeflea suaedae]
MSTIETGRRPLFTRERGAIALLFLQNGYLIGNWAPKVPEFAARLELQESVIGLMVLFFGLGSMAAMPLVGWWVSRYGSHGLLRVMVFVITPVFILINLAPDAVMGALALAVMGATVAGTDVAMNANAVEVERSERRAIMSSCHGFWSLGGLIGSASGGLIIDLAGNWAHAGIVTIVALILGFLAWPRIYSDRPHPDEEGVDGAPVTVPPFRNIALWLMGLMCLFSMIPEGASLDWSALYLRNEFGADAALSGLAFAAFSAGMAMMRFLGDAIRDRFGAVRTVRVSVGFTIAGLLLAGNAPGAAWAVAGFAIAGLGIANMVPVLFSAAGNMPGLRKGVGISFVTFFGYSGLLFAPSLIGLVAEQLGLAIVYVGICAPLVVVLAGSRLARYADRSE